MNVPVTRIALCLAFMSATFWFVSRAFLPLDPEFPNCISIRAENGVTAAGFVSIHGLSTLFVTKDDSEDWNRNWTERSDGHFCNFPVPPSNNFTAEPSGFTIHASLDGFSWSCPYWLMTALWLTVYVRSQPTIRFSLTDMLIATAAVALVAALVRLQFALLVAVPLNLATAALIAFFLFRTTQLYLRNTFSLWPIRCAAPENYRGRNVKPLTNSAHRSATTLPLTRRDRS